MNFQNLKAAKTLRLRAGGTKIFRANTHTQPKTQVTSRENSTIFVGKIIIITYTKSTTKVCIFGLIANFGLFRERKKL